LASEPRISLHDQEPAPSRFLEEALAGLQAQPKRLPCKFLYDERGSALFEQICELPEYYPTRTELGIMESGAAEMARRLGQNCLLVEYGSGSSTKTRLLLDHLDRPAAYVPVDISREHLLQAARALARSYAIEVLPVCADFTERFELPQSRHRAGSRAVYFPGSTIGNFTHEAAAELLQSVARLCGAGGHLLIGADLVKEPALLERAYDDAAGVTAAFNLNLLSRMNRELGCDFPLARFRHRAVWQPTAARIEMHLVSLDARTVHVGGHPIQFRAGERICTEHSHKYTLEGFAALAAEAGFRVEQVWTDRRGWFSVQALVVA